MAIFPKCPWCGASSPRPIGEDATSPCVDCRKPEVTKTWQYRMQLHSGGGQVSDAPLPDVPNIAAAIELAKEHSAMTGMRHDYFTVSRVDYVTTSVRQYGSPRPVMKVPA